MTFRVLFDTLRREFKAEREMNGRAQVMTPASGDKPKRLYKYQAYSVQSLDNLKNQILWFSKPPAFNDPPDCALPVTYDFGEVTEEEWREACQYWRSKIGPRFEGAFEGFDREYSTDGLPNESFRQLMVGVLRGYNPPSATETTRLGSI